MEEKQEETKKDEGTTEEELEKLKQSKFKQQLLPALRPVPTVISTSIIFTTFGIIFLIFGIILLVYSNKIVEVKIRYDDICKDKLGDECEIQIKVDKEMKPPIMFYYQLNGYYQNHRLYLKSRNVDQLNGKSFSLSEMEDDGSCDPIVKNKDLGIKDGDLAADGKSTLKANDLAIPCGLVAKSIFKDYYFDMYDSDNNNPIEIDENDIAWPADKKKIKNVDLSKQWIDMENEHFIVWMRPAGLTNFRKLFGRIKDHTLIGNYKISIYNEEDVSPFDGEKHIVLSTANGFGGKNYLLAYSYIIVGALCILLVVGFLIYKQIKHKRNKMKTK